MINGYSWRLNILISYWLRPKLEDTPSNGHLKVLPGRKHGHRGARAVKSQREKSHRWATAAVRKKDLEKAWFDTSFISGGPENCSFNSGNHPMLSKKSCGKKNICSRHPIKASSQSIKGNPGPMSKVPVLTLEFHDLFWSQRKDISEMLRLCSFRLTHRIWTHTDEFESCHVAWEICMYVYIYMIVYVYKAKSLNFTWYGWSHEEKQSTRQRVSFSAERPSTVCIWLRALNCTFAIIDRLDIQSSMCANYTIC